MRTFWNGPRPEPPKDPGVAPVASSSLPLRSVNASNAAAIELLVFRFDDADCTPLDLLLVAVLPASSESSFDFPPSLPGASWLGCASLVVPDREAPKISLRIL